MVLGVDWRQAGMVGGFIGVTMALLTALATPHPIVAAPIWIALYVTAGTWLQRERVAKAYRTGWAAALVSGVVVGVVQGLLQGMWIDAPHLGDTYTDLSWITVFGMVLRFGVIAGALFGLIIPASTWAADRWWPGAAGPMPRTLTPAVPTEDEAAIIDAVLDGEPLDAEAVADEPEDASHD